MEFIITLLTVYSMLLVFNDVPTTHQMFGMAFRSNCKVVLEITEIVILMCTGICMCVWVMLIVGQMFAFQVYDYNYNYDYRVATNCLW